MGETLAARIWKLLAKDEDGLATFEETVTASGELCRGDSSVRLRLLARAHQPPAFAPQVTKDDSEKYMLISQAEAKSARDADLTDSIDLLGKVEVSGALLTTTATEDYFPDAGGMGDSTDGPRGNRLGGGAGNAMSNSGTWAGSTLADTPVSRPESLSLAESPHVDQADVDNELAAELEDKCAITRQVESLLLAQPTPFSYEQFTCFNLMLYKLFGEAGEKSGMAERHQLAHAISLMTELGEAKRKSTKAASVTVDESGDTEEEAVLVAAGEAEATHLATSGGDGDADWSLNFAQLQAILFDESEIYDFFQKQTDITLEAERILKSLKSLK